MPPTSVRLVLRFRAPTHPNEERVKFSSVVGRLRSPDLASGAIELSVETDIQTSLVDDD